MFEKIKELRNLLDEIHSVKAAATSVNWAQLLQLIAEVLAVVGPLLAAGNQPAPTPVKS